MANFTPFDGNQHSLTPTTNDQSLITSGLFDIFGQVEEMVFNSFQSAFASMNNSSFTDQGSEYVFTLTLPNLKREHIQLSVENQQLILRVQQVSQSNSDVSQNYQSNSFAQCFDLSDIEEEKITAKLKNDTLTITLPKKEMSVINRRIIEVTE